MEYRYQFSKTPVNSQQLIQEIVAAELPTPTRVDTSGDDLFVYFASQLDSSQSDTLSGITSAHTPSATTQEIVRDKIRKAITFGHSLLESFVVENIMMGITQSGKTGGVADYLQKLNYYISVGSLYEAIAEISTLIGGGVPQELAPFVTEERLLMYKAKIEVFLEL